MKEKFKVLFIYILLWCIIFINLLFVYFKYNVFIIMFDLLLVLLFTVFLIKLYKKNKVNNELVKMLPHDIKTPINSIRCLLELMKLESGSKDKTIEYIDEINNCLDHINNISLNILENDYEKVKNYDVSINSLIDDVCSIILPVIKDKNIEFIALKLENDYIIKTDYQKIKQVLINLLSNACKYTPEYGKIIFEVLNTKEEVIFNVIDNGKGISEELLQTLFIKGKRGNNDNTEGHGFGLTLSKRMIEMIDGEIIVSSKINHGSKFSIVLKKVNDKISNHNILIVDDCKLNADLLAKLVSKHGFNSKVIYNPLEVINELLDKDKNYYKAIITDYRMPGINGKELCKKIREINKEIIVVCLSGEKIKKNKFIDYCLLKPVDINLLIKLLK